MPTNSLPATDSATELHKLIGDDATATFESKPTFIDSNPTSSASSENINEQRPGAGKEFREEAAVNTLAAKGLDEEEDEDDELEDDTEDEDEDDEDDDDDVEDEDDDDLDDDEEDEDVEDDEDEDEVEASSSSDTPKLWADGLLGYEDEADDARQGVDRVTGDVERERAAGRELTDDPDENPNDAYAEVDPEAEREEKADSNVVIRPVKPMDLAGVSYSASA